MIDVFRFVPSPPKHNKSLTGQAYFTAYTMSALEMSRSGSSTEHTHNREEDTPFIKGNSV